MPDSTANHADDGADPGKTPADETHSDGPGSRSARRADAGRKKGGNWGWLREIVVIIAIALVLSFLIKTFLFRAFFIPSGSMEDTLRIDDRIFVNLLAQETGKIERGDIVVFKDNMGWLPETPAQAEGGTNWLNEFLTFVGLLPDNSEQHLVKRVIGIGGDHVVCCDAQGRISVNGEPIEEPYLYPGATPSEMPFNVMVPEGKIWVMGDHRNASADSREHQRAEGTGFVDLDSVLGEAVVVAWPLSHFDILGSYPDVFEDVPDNPQSGALPTGSP
ncbi:signal peptidase I [Arthrobacter castelli]|uniref:signal peptidase I n=1 Tax=Arthrobacter castelli TaxID=271431 RepID=UPI00040B3355|nr:signal peptidase I [Arthrobacter castelli]